MGLASMKFEGCETVPLTEDDIATLQLMYSSRRNLIVIVYAILIPLAMLCSFRVDFNDRYSNKVHKWESENYTDRAGLSRAKMIMVNNLCLTLPVIISGIIIYRRRVNCLKKDIDANKKYKVLEEVAFKQHFPHTNQYYISLNDVDYLHHEVDEATFHSIEIGDKFPIYFACNSKYAFNKNGSFTII